MSAAPAPRCRWWRPRNSASPTSRSRPSSPTPRRLGYNDMTDGSRGTFSSSMATISAARNAIKMLRERAAKMWDIPVDDVVWEDGHATAKGEKHGNLSPLSQGDRGRGAQYGRADRRAQRTRRRRRGRVVRYPYLRCRGRSGDRRHAGGALHRGAGRRKGGASDLCRGPVPGWRGAGHRLGAERGVYLRRGRPAAEPRLPRLPHPGLLGPADDRHADPRDPQPQPPLRRARRGRDLDRAAAGGNRQCGVERGRRAHDPHPDVATTHPRRAGCKQRAG